MSRVLKIAAALAALALPVAAHASITVSSTDYGFTAPAGSGPLVTFDGPGDPYAGFAFSSTGTVALQTGNGTMVPGAAPAIGVGVYDATQYLSVAAGGVASLTGNVAYSAVSLYWGSIDTYNSLQLLGLDGSVLDTITSSTIGFGENGDQLLGNTNRRVTINSDTPFYGLKFGSTDSSFEVDQIKFTSAVPEPATWMMMLFGFGFMGAAMRKAKRKQGSAASFA